MLRSSEHSSAEGHTGGQAGCTVVDVDAVDDTLRSREIIVQSLSSWGMGYILPLVGLHILSVSLAS